MVFKPRVSMFVQCCPSKEPNANSALWSCELILSCEQRIIFLWLEVIAKNKSANGLLGKRIDLFGHWQFKRPSRFKVESPEKKPADEHQPAVIKPPIFPIICPPGRRLVNGRGIRKVSCRLVF